MLRVTLLPLLLLAALVLLGIGVWALAGRRGGGARGAPGRRAGPTASGEVSPQRLAALAQPFRGQLAAALEARRDVERQAERAPAVLRGELEEIAARVGRLIDRAYPRARHGTELQAYLLTLSADDPQLERTRRAAREIEAEMAAFVERIEGIRGSVYQLLTDATALARDRHLSDDLEDLEIELGALESAFRETEREVTEG